MQVCILYFFCIVVTFDVVLFSCPRTVTPVGPDSRTTDAANRSITLHIYAESTSTVARVRQELCDMAKEKFDETVLEEKSLENMKESVVC